MSPSQPIAAEQDLLAEVLRAHDRTPDPRLRQVLEALVRHLHQFVSEVRPTHEEWMQGIEFLTATGHKSDENRQEFILLSDVLGISTLMELINHEGGGTEATVLGPYYARNSPMHANGDSLVENDDGGARFHVRGTVRSRGGGPIAGATVDVWSCASNGLYPAQDPEQNPTNLRGQFLTDAQGGYRFTTLRPVNYTVPTDGPVGALLRAADRPSMRAAHVHLMVSAPGHHPVVTHLFDSACPYLPTDSVFSVRSSLVRNFAKAADGTYSAEFDVTLIPEHP